MDNRSRLRKRVVSFFNGRGFYIVLSLCVVVTGISAWILLADDDGSGLVKAGEQTGSVPAGVWSGVPSPEPDAGLPVMSIPATPAPVAPAPVEAAPPVVDRPAPSATPTPEASPSPTPAPAQEPETVTVRDLKFIWPVAGPIIKEYSPDMPVFSKTMGDWRTHDGVDISASMGARVMAVADGTVEKVYDDDLYGTTVVIYHADGVRSIYANLAGMPTVKEGDAIAMGAVIGSVSDTALAEIDEVTHLHFAMTLHDEPVDPAEYLPRK